MTYSGVIGGMESAGSGGYFALGPITKTGDRAYGKHQVMGANIPSWTEKHYGKKLTPEEFLLNPEAQEKVFEGQFGTYVKKHGPAGAAKAWFAGEGGMNDPGRKDILGTSVADYEKKFLKGTGQPIIEGLGIQQQPTLGRPSIIEALTSPPTFAPGGESLFSVDPTRTEKLRNFVTDTTGSEKLADVAEFVTPVGWAALGLDEFSRAGEAFQQGDYGGAGAHGFLGATTFIPGAAPAKRAITAPLKALKKAVSATGKPPGAYSEAYQKDMNSISDQIAKAGPDAFNFPVWASSEVKALAKKHDVPEEDIIKHIFDDVDSIQGLDLPPINSPLDEKLGIDWSLDDLGNKMPEVEALLKKNPGASIYDLVGLSDPGLPGAFSGLGKSKTKVEQTPYVQTPKGIVAYHGSEGPGTKVPDWVPKTFDRRPEGWPHEGKFDPYWGEFGPHFGTPEQASARVYDPKLTGQSIMPVEIATKNPLVTQDAGNWDPSGVLEAIAGARNAAGTERAFGISELGKLNSLVDDFYKTFSSKKKSELRKEVWDEARRLLEDKGYDSIKYWNIAEGSADSYIPIKRGSVKSKLTGETLFGLLGSLGILEGLGPDFAQAQEGNIDIDKRTPVTENGQTMTELSFSIGTDQGEVLIPRIVNGKKLTQEEAIKHYEKTGEHLGIFKTPAEADAFAKSLSKRQGEHYNAPR